MWSELTRREHEILRELQLGLGTPDISAKLFISPATTRNHLQSLMLKLNAHSRVEVLAAARSHQGGIGGRPIRGYSAAARVAKFCRDEGIPLAAKQTQDIERTLTCSCTCLTCICPNRSADTEPDPEGAA